MAEAKDYIKNLEQTEDSVRIVFTKAVEDYLHGEISAKIFNGICEEIQELLNANEIVVRDAQLLATIDEGVELMFYRKSDLEGLIRAEDSFKQYSKNAGK